MFVERVLVNNRLELIICPSEEDIANSNPDLAPSQPPPTPCMEPLPEPTTDMDPEPAVIPAPAPEPIIAPEPVPDWKSDLVLELVTVYALLKIKVLHDAIEEPFCLNGSIKNL